jgi:hypothetical protein
MVAIQGAGAYTYVSNNIQPTTKAAPSAPSTYTASSSPFGGDMVSLLLDNSDNLANYIAGGYNAYKQGPAVGEALKKITTDFSGSMTTVFKAGLSGAGIGAIAMGAARGWEEAVKMSQGHTTLGRATGGIVGSTIQGTVGGFGGVMAGGLSNLIAAGIGLGGAPLTVATVIGGAVGAAVCSKLVNTSGIESQIARAVDG